MAEFIATTIQTVEPNANVQFTDTVVNGNCFIVHRTGSGLITLRGAASRCRSRFKVSFGGNIQVPTGGTVGPISLAISVDGEPLSSTVMTVTPAAVAEPFNVFAATYIEVNHCNGASIGVRNISNIDIQVANANIIIEPA